MTKGSHYLAACGGVVCWKPFSVCLKNPIPCHAITTGNIGFCGRVVATGMVPPFILKRREVPGNVQVKAIRLIVLRPHRCG
jgi:hypothetical protein